MRDLWGCVNKIYTLATLHTGCVLSHDGCFYIASLPGLISHLGRLLQLQDHDPPAQPATSTAPDAHLDEASVKQYLPVLIAFKREEGSQGGLRPTRMTEQAAQVSLLIPHLHL